MAARASAAAASCIALLLVLAGTSSAQLSTSFYSTSCPGLYGAVKSVVQAAIAREKRMGASIVRLFFHDCFVQVLASYYFLIIYLHHLGLSSPS
jgi:peroxidase